MRTAHGANVTLAPCTRAGSDALNSSPRSVSPTEAGERLLFTVGRRFDEIEAELEALTQLRGLDTEKRHEQRNMKAHI
jgi:hypothetical protein